MTVIHQYLGGPYSGARLETESSDLTQHAESFVGYVLHDIVRFADESVFVWAFIDPVLSVTKSLKDLAACLSSCLKTSSCFVVGRDKFFRRSEAYSFNISELEVVSEAFNVCTGKIACNSRLFQRRQTRGIAHLSYGQIFHESTAAALPRKPSSHF
jgi:hypothetical protein